MKTRNIEFDDDGKFSQVTVVMTAEEAAYVASVLGKFNWVMAEEHLPGGGPLNVEIYDALVGEVFNRLYDDGVDEYLRGRAK